METQITFKKTAPSDSFKDIVQAEAEKIAGLLGEAGICRVTVEGMAQNHQGKRFAIHIEAVPEHGASVRVQEEGPTSSRSDPYSVVHQGFRRLRQQLISATGAEQKRRRKRESRKTA